MNQLTERDYLVLCERFSGRSLEKIAIKFHCSRERVRQILAKAMRRLMLAEEKWGKAERAYCRIQAERKAERLQQWSSMVAAPGELAAIEASLPSATLTLDDMEVPVRVFNVLRNNGLESLESICQLKAEDFLRFKNAGRKSLNDLRAELDRIGAPHNLGKPACRGCGMPETNCCCG
jgi:hypothetical protein